MRNRLLVIGLAVCALGGAATIALVAWLIIRTPGFDKLQSRIDLEIVASKLDGRIEEARKAGIPLTQDALKLPSDTPQARELEAKMVALATRLNAKNGDDTLLNTIGKAVNSRNLQQADQLLKPLNTDLDQVAIDLKEHKFPIGDLDFGYLTAFEAAYSSREVARALGYRSRTRAGLKDVEGALGDIRTLMTLKERLNEMRVYPGDVRALIAFSQAQNCLAHAIYEFQEDPGPLKQIDTLLAELKQIQDPENFLETEIYMGLSSVRNIYLINKYDDLGALLKEHPDARDLLQRDGKPKELWARANMATYLAMATEIVNARGKHDDPADEARRLDEISNRWLDKTGREHVFIEKFWTSLFKMVFDRQKQSLARIDCTKALLKVCEFRIANGRLPKSLAEANFNAIDPFSGVAYKYKVNGASFRIYSVNVDGKDDGGQTAGEMRRKGVEDPATSDLAVAIPPIP